MNTRTVRSAVHRNAHAKLAFAYGWIGKRPVEPEAHGRTFHAAQQDLQAREAAEAELRSDDLRR
jgi:hypothetical protein